MAQERVEIYVVDVFGRPVSDVIPTAVGHTHPAPGVSVRRWRRRDSLHTVAHQGDNGFTTRPKDSRRDIEDTLLREPRPFHPSTPLPPIFPEPTPRPPAPRPPVHPEPTPRPPAPRPPVHPEPTPRHRHESDLEPEPEPATYYSSICKLTCSEEAKLRIVNHLSLWKTIAAESVQGPTVPEKRVDITEYFAVIEDDNVATERLLEYLPQIVSGMRVRGIDVLQLSADVYVGTRAHELITEGTPAIYSHPMRFGTSLSAYIISAGAARKLHEYFEKNRPSTDLALELGRAENALGLRRHAIANSSDFIRHDSRFVSARRLHAGRGGARRRAEGWLAERYPDTYSRLSTPLFSLFGTYDVSFFSVAAILFFVVLIVFDVHARLAWMLAGALLAFSLD
ncbi:IMV heparin binding surface protein [Eastern grey kangaroopox virus]|uniref:IMV heparin binding surface protein n=1 Tax=Eastern grey kangaroopox virus TaxID=2042482 RepID=A0A2C9DT49_9POXV|nr:IMV heparin binding surface protein [Eastern grey kangaroopox virus]ATI21182.1 IMV heparin binding surface protein [Eastern grey kangaroopox virus]AXK50179.1 IMV heparin binding surface protein [Eastern grey kangaroopox virus]